MASPLWLKETVFRRIWHFGDKLPSIYSFPCTREHSLFEFCVTTSTQMFQIDFTSHPLWYPLHICCSYSYQAELEQYTKVSSFSMGRSSGDFHPCPVAPWHTPWEVPTPPRLLTPGHENIINGARWNMQPGLRKCSSSAVSEAVVWPLFIMIIVVMRSRAVRSSEKPNKALLK